VSLVLIISEIYIDVQKEQTGMALLTQLLMLIKNILIYFMLSASFCLLRTLKTLWFCFDKLNISFVLF